MADVDIEVESSDLKAAIDLLGSLGDKFVKTVNQMETANKRLERASKASADTIDKAFDKVVGAALQQDINQARGYWQQYDKALGITGKSANQLGATFDKLGNTLKAEAEQSKKYWQQYDETIGVTGKKATELGATFSKLGDILKNEATQAKQYWDNFNQSMGINSSATNSGAGFGALEAEVKLLTEKYNPLIAATEYYEREVKNMTRAHQLGITTAKQYEAQLEQVKIEFEALNKGTYLAGSRFNQFGQMAEASGKRMQRVGMYAQQAGYQFGDFFVQLQSGTNIGVAFSQQFAQLAGLIPGVAGAVTTFAVIGLGMLIQNMTRATDEARKGKDTYEDLGNTLDKIKDARFDNITTNLTAAAEQARKEFEALFKLIEQQELKNLKTILQEPVKEFAKAIEDFKRQRSLLNQIGKDGPAFNVMGFGDIGKAQQALQWLNNIQGETKEELAESLRLTVNILNATGSMTDEVRAKIVAMQEELGLTDLINDKIREGTDYLKSQRDFYVEQTIAIKDATREAEQAVALEEIKKKHGEDSLNYLNQEKQFRLENFAIEAQRVGLDQQHIDYLLQILDNQIEIENATRATGASVEDILAVLNAITGVDISGVFTRAQAAASGLLATVNAVGRGLSQLGKLGLEAEALKAQRAALAAGKSPGEARVAGDVVRYGQSLEGVPNWAKPFMSKAYENQSLENLRYEEQIASDTKAYNKAAKGGGKGRKGKKSDEEKDWEKLSEKFTDFINDFALNIEQQERLNGLYGEQREKQEKIIEIENRLGDARVLASDKQIEAWAEQELALEQLQERQDFYFETLSGSFENLFMEVVDGTSSISDAFKAMLVDIIREIYQSQVAKPAADWLGGIVGGLFSAKGNAFASGGAKFFANGGVVDSPTAFQYSGGLGVMGEAGPEAIMPLKRNSQGQLGVQVSGSSQGNIVVNQNFNFSANGDESVKRIIQTQMPNIQKAAVDGVISAKRRSVRGL